MRMHGKEFDKTFKKGDKVILLDFSHETRGNKRSDCAAFWVDNLDRYIGKELTIKKYRWRAWELEEASYYSFNTHWLRKANILSEELFEI